MQVEDQVLAEVFTGLATVGVIAELKESIVALKVRKNVNTLTTFEKSPPGLTLLCESGKA